MNKPATVLLIDDHPLFRKGLHQLIGLSEDIEIIGEASSGMEGVNLALKLEPDLILLDLNMQGMDGLDTLNTLRDKDCTSRIIMLTVSDNDADVINCIRAGADGYLLKDMEPEDILSKIEQATLGRMAISNRLAEALATALRKPVPGEPDLLSKLTSRERQVLSHVAKGLCNKLIARELDIGEGTVKVHVKHLLKKLGMRSRVEAAVWMASRR